MPQESPALRAMQHAGDEVGLNGEGRQTVGLHDLRHSFVAIALANGVTLPEAAMLARHANPRDPLAVRALQVREPPVANSGIDARP